MFNQINPSDSPKPPGAFSWGLDLQSPRRLVFVSGQIGVDADGRVGESFIEQCRMTWRNVGNVLRDAHLSPVDIVGTGIFIARQVIMTDELKAEFNAIRAEFLCGRRPSSTMIYVHALMDPSWLIEIDAIAAQ